MQVKRAAGNGDPEGAIRDRYKWVALSNTSLGAFMASLDASIVIVALPAIFRGVGLDPLDPSNVGYLLWMIMGYVLVLAVLVVSVGRLGDIFGRVRIYNAGFVVFTVASVLLSLDPFHGGAGAMWLILFRMVQAVGGAMLQANAAAIIVDAFPENQRGTALGANQVSALAGQSLGLVAGGLLAVWDWRAVFWVNVPVGILGTIWAYRSLRETSVRTPARIDWLGNITFAAGASTILAAVCYGLQSYGTDTMGWENPLVITGVLAGIALLGLFAKIEARVAQPMFDLALFRVRAYAVGGIANVLAATARGGLQLMLIIWLQGIWLPLHGVDFEHTPMWAGICLLPLTLGIMIAGPTSGYLSDRYGSRLLATAGLLVFAFSFIGLMLMPVDFSLPVFVVLIGINGLGSGMFAAPNTASMMNSVPPHQRGAASGMRQTLQNAGMSFAVAIFFSLLVLGLSKSLPGTVTDGLAGQGVDARHAAAAADVAPASTVFAAFLGENPVEHLLKPSGELNHVSPTQAERLTSTDYFPDLISGPFHDGLSLAFLVASLMGFLGAGCSLLRQTGRQPRTLR